MLSSITQEVVEENVNGDVWIPLTHCEFVKNNVQLNSLFLYFDVNKDKYVLYNSEKDLVHELPKDFV